VIRPKFASAAWSCLILVLGLMAAVGAPAPGVVSAAEPGAPPRQDETPPPEVPPVVLPEGTLNIALLGVDKRPTRSFANTDVIIIASINPDTPSVVLLSIPRDTLVYIPGHDVSKVNTAFALGGPDLFKDTIRHNFGLHIDYYAMVNFQAVVNAVEVLGGIEVVATCPLHHVFPRDPYYMGGEVLAADWTDTFTGEVWKRGTRIPTLTIDIPKPGVYALDGLQALAYIRARKGVPGGDVDRGRREQRVARALFSRAKQVDILPRIPALFEQFQENVQTDLPLETILYFASIADRFNNAIIRSRFLDWGGANGAVGVSGPLALPDPADRQGYVQRILSVALNQRPNDGIPIEVWNGTADPGFGTAAADRLAELGFRIVDVRAADAIVERTVLHDYTTTKKGSATALLLRTFDLPKSAVAAEPRKDGPRYRIVVGPDFNTCYYAQTAEAAGNDLILPADPAGAAVPAAPTIIAEAPPTPTVALAAEPALPAEVQVSAGNVINVRSGPSAEYRVIGRLREGQIAPALGRSLDQAWWHIRYGGKLGWVAAEYVQAYVPPEPAAQAAPAAGEPPSVAVNRGDLVNVRSGPGVDYDVLGRLAGGQTAGIVGRSSDEAWWQIRYGAQQGWVSARYVQVKGDLASVPTIQ
jgi:anionic cell wall polymer biosynthesis LytR-Cps2A-Psr (LCP) family protein/uncharacterized protein YraI